MIFTVFFTPAVGQSVSLCIKNWTRCITLITPFGIRSHDIFYHLPILQSDQPSCGGPSTRWSWKRRRWSSAARSKETLNQMSAGGKMTLMFLVEGMHIYKNILKIGFISRLKNSRRTVTKRWFTVASNYPFSVTLCVCVCMCMCECVCLFITFIWQTAFYAKKKKKTGGIDDSLSECVKLMITLNQPCCKEALNSSVRPDTMYIIYSW